MLQTRSCLLKGILFLGSLRESFAFGYTGFIFEGSRMSPACFVSVSPPKCQVSGELYTEFFAEKM